MKKVDHGQRSSDDSASATDASHGASSSGQVAGDERCIRTDSASSGVHCPDRVDLGQVVGSLSSAVDNRNQQSIYRSHEYEELPNSRFANPDYGYASADDNKMQLPPRPFISSMANLKGPLVSSHAPFPNVTRLCQETSGSDQVTLIDGSQSIYNSNSRKRINPLYCTLPVQDVSAPTGCTCDLAVTLSLFALGMAIIACAVAVTAVLFTHKTDGSSAHEFLMRIESLEQRHHMLIQALNDSVSENQETVAAHGLYSGLITVLRNDFIVKLTDLRDDMNNKLSNISKLQGPESFLVSRAFTDDIYVTNAGPPGVGNLTMCKYNISSYGTSAQIETPTLTNWIPETVSIAESWRITGVTCSTDGGLYSSLTTRSFPGSGLSIVQFRCECQGRSKLSSMRQCYIHYWSCPVLS